MGLTRFLKRVFLGKTDGVVRRPLAERKGLDETYYQNLHDENNAYKGNNWLLNQPQLVALIADKTVMELGCGNGRFTEIASKTAKYVFGLDWARSELFDDSAENVEFMKADALKATFPKVDIACSGDVLEHFAPADIDYLLARLHACATVNFHVIACYDDKHSHLTIQPKEWWLEQFQKLDSSYRLLNRDEVVSGKRMIAVISNHKE